MKSSRCRDHLRNFDIRGTYLVDNDDSLRLRVPRGQNKDFILSYLFVSPACRLSEVRKALLMWRGIKVCDDSRGIYASYFYDYYHHKWYHKKYWTKIRDSNDKDRAVLTTFGMSNVNMKLVESIRKWKESPAERIRIIVHDKQQAESLVGVSYNRLFPKKL